MKLNMPAATAHPSPAAVVAPTASHVQHDMDEDFGFMADAFRATRGFRNADDVAANMCTVSRGGVGDVARWIVRRHVLNVYWRGTYWLPEFQFVPASLMLKQPVAVVLKELVPVLDDWSLCRWFATPCEWLDGMSPVEVLHSNPAEIFHAARAHRFVLVG